MTRPLGSTRITRLHRYYEAARPCAPHRYSAPCRSCGLGSLSTDNRKSSWADSSSPCRRTAVLQVGGQQNSMPADSSSPSGRTGPCLRTHGGSASEPARRLRERPPTICLGASSATPARRRLQAACRHAGEQNRCGEPTCGLGEEPFDGNDPEGAAADAGHSLPHWRRRSVTHFVDAGDVMRLPPEPGRQSVTHFVRWWRRLQRDSFR